MKKCFAIAVGLLLIAGCTNDSLDDNGGVNEGMKSFTTFTASLDDVAGTRVHIVDPSSSGNKNVAWDEGDEIFVFSDEDKDLKTYTLTAVTDGMGQFTGDRVRGGERFYALYPADGWVVDSENDNILHYDMTDNRIAGNYNDFCFRGPMIASDTGNNFTFKQLTGMIHIAVGDIFQLESITLSGNNEESLAGMCEVDLSDDIPVLKVSEQNQAKSIKLNVSETLKETNSDFYFILPPTKFDEGFTLTIGGSDDYGNHLTLEKTTTNEVTIERIFQYLFPILPVPFPPSALRCLIDAIGSIAKLNS